MQNQGTRKKRAAAAETSPAIPDKLYFRIGEAARLLSIQPYVLRFWESEFPQLRPNKGGTGQRLYRRRDVEMALRIKRLLYEEGYTIPGARQLLKAEGQDRGASKGDAAEREAADSPSTPAEKEPAQMRLLRMRRELREIAAILGGDGPGALSPGPPPRVVTKRTLHLAPRRDAFRKGLPSLFPHES